MLPAALTALLMGMLALQFALVRSDAPVDESVGAAVRVQSRPLPPMALVAAEPVIRERPIFAPGRSSDGGGSGADPLAGAQVSGAWAVGRNVNLVLRGTDGAVRTLRVGQSVNQWVLASITPSGARFWREGKSITVPFGSSAPPSASTDASQKEEQSQ
jgi:hypothetical protein